MRARGDALKAVEKRLNALGLRRGDGGKSLEKALWGKQWRRRAMDVGIPPLLTSFEACFGNWHGRDLQSLCWV